MSGVYLLVIVTLWIWVTKLLWTTWRRWRNAEGLNRRWVDAAALITTLLWFGVSFWYGGGQKYYWDAQVRELCAKDGGVKIYETVKLPAEKFDKWGNVRIPDRRYAKPSDEYYNESEVHFYRLGNPTLLRSRSWYVRRSNGKVLGEAISYGRGGGDLPGPWHESSFHCPPIADAEGKLQPSIFLKGSEK